MASQAASTVSAGVFLEEVQKYPCLYNKFCKEYKDKYIKINCWRKIGEKFSLTPEEAEKKFKNLRTTYGRHLKNQKNVPSGSGRDAIPDLPKDFQNLEWLQQHICFRKTSGNFPKQGLEEDDDGGDIEQIDVDRDSPAERSIDSAEQSSAENLDPENQDEQTPRDEQSISESFKAPNNGKRPWSSHSKKATKTKEQICPVEQALLKSATSLAEHVKQAAEVKRQKKDEVDVECEDSLYCKSLIPRLRRLDQRSRAYVRMQIEQLFFQAEFGGFTGNATENFGSTMHQPSGRANDHYQGGSSYLML